MPYFWSTRFAPKQVVPAAEPAPVFVEVPVVDVPEPVVEVPAPEPVVEVPAPEPVPEPVVEAPAPVAEETPETTETVE